MSPPIDEGDPVAPQTALISAGLHERDVYIAAFATRAPLFEEDKDGRWKYPVDRINARIIEAATDMVARKEISK